MDVKFTVGEFAKLCGISKQALIFYDNEGIIKPKFKDENNGYRYYTPDQLEQLDTIMILREIGLSLKEIKAHMENRSLKSSLQILEAQKNAIHEKIERLTAIEERIEEKSESLKQVYSQDSSFKIKSLPERILAVEKIKKPMGLLEVDIALKKLMKKFRGNSTNHFYQVGDIVPYDNLQAHDFLKFSYAFVPIEENSDDMETLIMPKGKYEIGLHFGPYTTMGETYIDMLADIESKGREVAGDAYEFCILDSLTSSTPEKYCTQILIPIE